VPTRHQHFANILDRRVHDPGRSAVLKDLNGTVAIANQHKAGQHSALFRSPTNYNLIHPVYSPNGILDAPVQNRVLARPSGPGARPANRARAS
jgi:hypothetical protein